MALTQVQTGMIADAAVTQAKLGANVAGNGPAFYAKRTASAFSVSANTWTKIAFNVEMFDTNSCYDKDTNYRFTPTVAGYYQVNAAINASSNVSIIYLSIYQNGGGVTLNSAPATGSSGVSIGTILYCNGTTDYIEAYCYFSSASSINQNDYSSFSAAMVRAG